MPRPTYTPPPNPAPSLGDPNFSANASGYLGWFPTFGAYNEALADWYQSDFAKELANGSAALPSMAFANDLDTGLFLVGPNQIGFTVGGSRKVLLSPTEYRVDVPLTGTSVSQSLLEKLPNRLIKARDYGLGVSMPITDNNLNTAVETGNYSSAAVTFTNGPDSLPSTTNIALRVDQAQNPNNGHQKLYATSAGRTFERYFAGGSFGPWEEVYDTGNAVGTVSQVAGVNVGAIVEEGGNANGHYCKIAGGLQICWGRTITSGSEAVTQAFPAAFVDDLAKPAFTANTTNLLGVIAQTPIIRAVSMDINTFRSSTDARVGTAIEWTAIGRWAL